MQILVFVVYGITKIEFALTSGSGGGGGWGRKEFCVDL
jgi:hypothetical protein